VRPRWLPTAKTTEALLSLKSQHRFVLIPTDPTSLQKAACCDEFSPTISTVGDESSQRTACRLNPGWFTLGRYLALETALVSNSATPEQHGLHSKIKLTAADFCIRFQSVSGTGTVIQ
jgi:hypothetical protein